MRVLTFVLAAQPVLEPGEVAETTDNLVLRWPVSLVIDLATHFVRDVSLWPEGGDGRGGSETKWSRGVQQRVPCQQYDCRNFRLTATPSPCLTGSVTCIEKPGLWGAPYRPERKVADSPRVPCACTWDEEERLYAKNDIVSDKQEDRSKGACTHRCIFSL